MKHFTGSKGGAGVHQQIISLMPPHRVYVEPFLGRGVILKTKRPALLNIGIDLDAGVIADFDGQHRRQESDTTLVHGDALALLPVLKVESDWLVYADPPYLGSTRSCKRNYYGREMQTEAVHDRLLSILTVLQCMVMVSGYWSELYSRRLAGWSVKSFWTTNRRGKSVQEFVWCNFPDAVFLHDARFIGNNFTRRQGLKRKAARWKTKLLAMPDPERQFILESLLTVPARK